MSEKRKFYPAPVRYNQFLTQFPMEADAIRFYIGHTSIYCPVCSSGGDELKYQRKGRNPYLAYCPSCRKEFTIFIESVFKRSHADLRYWLYLGYVYYQLPDKSMQLNLKAFCREMNISAYTTIFRMNKKLKNWFENKDADYARERLLGALLKKLQADSSLKTIHS